MRRRKDLARQICPRRRCAQRVAVVALQQVLTIFRDLQLNPTDVLGLSASPNSSPHTEPTALAVRNWACSGAIINQGSISKCPDEATTQAKPHRRFGKERGDDL